MCDRIFMIFRGRKVLDGSLDDIQQQYGADTVRVRTAGGAGALRGIPEVESVNDFGQVQEVRVKGDPQRFLQNLVARSPVYQFEISRPSLQDIFVRIARPLEKETADSTGQTEAVPSS
jgi:ABC-2 type transport system ATP-binding protein